jgi:hypothetical protein
MARGDSARPSHRVAEDDCEVISSLALPGRTMLLPLPTCAPDEGSPLQMTISVINRLVPKPQRKRIVAIYRSVGAVRRSGSVHDNERMDHGVTR